MARISNAVYLWLVGEDTAALLVMLMDYRSDSYNFWKFAQPCPRAPVILLRVISRQQPSRDLA
eukprot:717676-Heterocapsa_arctica.AAC.1